MSKKNKKAEKTKVTKKVKKVKKVKIELPGKGDYGEVTAYMVNKETYTKPELIKFLKKKCKKDHVAAVHTAVVMLSPRKSSNRGDPRGNTSNPWGHLAYNEKLPRRINKVTGKKEEQEFSLRERKVALEPRKRVSNPKVEAQKVATKTGKTERTEKTERTKTKVKA